MERFIALLVGAITAILIVWAILELVPRQPASREPHGKDAATLPGPPNLMHR